MGRWGTRLLALIPWLCLALIVALPIAVAVAVSHNLYAMIGWGLVASIVQLLTFIAARLAMPRLNESIPQGKLASGVFLASLAIGVGILNAGCIV